MSYDVILEANSETSFPFSKIGGKDPAKITFSLKDNNGNIIQTESFVVTFDDPVPDSGVPVVFTGTGDKYSMNIKVESNVRPIEYHAARTKINKQLTLLEYGDKTDKHILAVLVCSYEASSREAPRGVHVWSVRAGK
jgi:hypothetical protein